jgi:DNA-binding TFAR19-related protein (PDSD5 family)
VAVEAVLLVRNNNSSASQLSRSIPYDIVLLTLNRQQQNDARQHILNQILHPEAADRLGRIRLVKEERAADIENRLITLAQTGQLRQKVTEAQLKELLNAMSESKEEEKIVVSRRKAWDDDDDLDL